MHTTAPEVTQGRSRRTYSTAFKAELVEQCCQLGVSSAAVAVSHGMNPNVLRRWIKERACTDEAPRQARKVRASQSSAPAFVALPMNAMAAHPPHEPNPTIQIEVLRNGTTVLVRWPTSDVTGSAAWVREVLR